MLGMLGIKKNYLYLRYWPKVVVMLLKVQQFFDDVAHLDPLREIDQVGFLPDVSLSIIQERQIRQIDTQIRYTRRLQPSKGKKG